MQIEKGWWDGLWPMAHGWCDQITIHPDSSRARARRTTGGSPLSLSLLSNSFTLSHTPTFSLSFLSSSHPPCVQEHQCNAQFLLQLLSLFSPSLALSMLSTYPIHAVRQPGSPPRTVTHPARPLPLHFPRSLQLKKSSQASFAPSSSTSSSSSSCHFSHLVLS